jgi:hypothetical protein
MKEVESQIELSEGPTILMTQALFVTAGPLAGRICENDDDDYMLATDFEEWELDWIEEAGVSWRKLKPDPDLSPEVAVSEYYSTDGVDCEIVTFGRYLDCSGHYRIPRQFLRPATIKDLIQRHQEIGEAVFRRAWIDRRKIDAEELSHILIEQAYITDEIWRRESRARTMTTKKSVFLCHASADKGFVRQVRNDLANAGHSAWIDEFEIKVGDSIVTKISEATAEADALVLFLSRGAMASDWVKREWSSALARSLAGSSIRILPVLIEDSELPPLLADIKYADFRMSYHSGLEELLAALQA